MDTGRPETQAHVKLALAGARSDREKEARSFSSVLFLVMFCVICPS